MYMHIIFTYPYVSISPMTHTCCKKVAAGHDGQAVAALERAELACISSHLSATEDGVLRKLLDVHDFFVFFPCFFVSFITSLFDNFNGNV